MARTRTRPAGTDAPGGEPPETGPKPPARRTRAAAKPPEPAGSSPPAPEPPKRRRSTRSEADTSAEPPAPPKARTVRPKPEAPDPEASRPERPKAEGPRAEAPRSEAPRRRRRDQDAPQAATAEPAGPAGEAPPQAQAPASAEGATQWQPMRRRRSRWGRRRERREQVPQTPEAAARAEAARAEAAQKKAQRKAEQQRKEAERRAQQQARREEQRRRQQAQQEAQAQRRAARKRQAFGSTWWSARWTAVLETFGWAARVGRGAEYARQGAVRDLHMDEWGVVTAHVQGSRPEPYTVELSIVHLPDDVWNRILEEMSKDALLAAKLLAGEMPEDIEDAFYAAGVTLFPYEGQEILAACSCPDQVNPCKHIAAVFYTLAQEFDRDPFLIFRFRGRSAEQVAAALRALRAESETVEEDGEVVVSADEPLPLDQCLDRFWTLGEAHAAFRVAIAPPATPGAVLLRLGQPNGWDGARGFIFTMAPYYQALSEKALAAAYAEDSTGNGQPIAAPAASA